jgi:hypothetical protein
LVYIINYFTFAIDLQKQHQMETKEKTLTHQESLNIIESMIATAKNRISEDGFHFILWGVLVIIASLANYFLASVLTEGREGLVWLIMPLVGAPIATFYEVRKNKNEKVKTYIDHIYGYMWMAFGFTIFAVIFISVRNGLSPIPFILAQVGFATFVSGVMTKFRALIAGGIIFWVAAFAASYADPAVQLFINAGATFLGYVIPGILLWRNYKLQGNV